METTPGSTPRHPMRLVVEQTGVSPDLLRAWERRYRVVTPGRSAGGQRLYSDADLERLSLVVQAMEPGRSIGQMASLSIEELRRLVAEDAERGAAHPTPPGDFLEEAVAAVAELMPERLQTVLRSALLSLGATGFLEEVLAPLLHRIGELWHAGKLGIAQEHAASAVVRGILGWMIDAMDVAAKAPRAVLACLAGERHELGALLATAAAVHAGWRVAYLGPDLPAGEIRRAAAWHRATLVGVSVVAPEDAGAAIAELEQLRRELEPGTALLVGGASAAALVRRDELGTLVRDLAHWRTLLRLHAPVQA